MPAAGPVVALVHYHLRGGGVTRVAGHVRTALEGRGGRLIILTGEPVANDHPLAEVMRVIPELAYSDGPSTITGDALAATLRAEARAATGQLPDLWHIHNHSLGKNLALPLAVRALADAGERLLLHIHDFAEDGRPGRYAFLLDGLGDGNPHRLAQALYPTGPNVHYAVLNQRDLEFLKAAGQPVEQIHHLPNAVTFGLARPACPPSGDEELVLYPTRAIRRKNIGELLLWAACAPEGRIYATTMEPQNPAQRQVYEAWVALAEELDLPVRFAIGKESDAGYEALLASAHAAISTSVGEGFGLAFLEPWLAGIPLLGRSLPELVGEFGEAGVDLSHLYSRATVPTDWVGHDALRYAIADALCRSRASYRRKTSDDDIERALGSAVTGDAVDFGCLNEALQADVLRRVATDSGAAGALSCQPDAANIGAEMIAQNAERIHAAYGIERYADRMLAAYLATAGSPAGNVWHLNGAALLDRFLDPSRFRLLLC